MGVLGPMSSAMYIRFTLVHWHVRVEEYMHLNGHRVPNLVSYLHMKGHEVSSFTLMKFDCTCSWGINLVTFLIKQMNSITNIERDVNGSMCRIHCIVKKFTSLIDNMAYIVFQQNLTHSIWFVPKNNNNKVTRSRCSFQGFQRTLIANLTCQEDATITCARSLLEFGDDNFQTNSTTHKSY